MKLIEPRVELLSELDISPESHIARCARTCYGREYKEPNQEADKKMVEGLIKRGHLSMLRHASVYGKWLIFNPPLADLESEFVDTLHDGKGYEYVSTNRQYGYEHTLDFPPISPNEFLEYAIATPHLFNLFRLTFCITTQISTSRELNRVSPNAIAERSTRFCTLKDGLEIVRPWWWDDVDSRYIGNKIHYEKAVKEAEFFYRWMIADGMRPEDARGVLPLDTATKVVYTYSVQEWKHIIDLRYYGTTGKPQPNAKLVIGMVREQINQFAKGHNIDYKL